MVSYIVFVHCDIFFFSSRRRHTRWPRDWSSDVCSSDLEERIQILLNDKGIIRNKLKILAAVNNAQRFIEIQNEFGSFSEYIWKFVNHQPIQNKVVNYQNQASTSAISDKISKDLKQRGFNFLGSTTVYAFLQATGLINDHEEKCFRNKQLNKHQKN